MRVVWKNLDKSGLDFGAIDFTNAYCYRCDFTDSVFGVLVNATFIECNLTRADFSKAVLRGLEVKRCVMKDATFATVSKMTSIAKQLLDKWGFRAFLPLHSHEFIAEVIRKDAEGRPEWKVESEWFITYIKAHYDLSWNGIMAACVTKFGTVRMGEFLGIFGKDYPELIGQGQEALKRI